LEKIWRDGVYLSSLVRKSWNFNHALVLGQKDGFLQAPLHWFLSLMLRCLVFASCLNGWIGFFITSACFVEVSSLSTFPTNLANCWAFRSRMVGTAVEPTTLSGSIKFDWLVGSVDGLLVCSWGVDFLTYFVELDYACLSCKMIWTAAELLWHRLALNYRLLRCGLGVAEIWDGLVQLQFLT
jgi:hypothetical protein